MIATKKTLGVHRTLPGNLDSHPPLLLLRGLSYSTAEGNRRLTSRIRPVLLMGQRCAVAHNCEDEGDKL